MADTINLMSRTVKVRYVTDEGCTALNSKGMLSVVPITARNSRIAWKGLPIQDPTEVFYIQKSGNPLSGWVTIARATILDTHVVDLYANNTMNRHDHEYYRILAPQSLYVIGTAKTEGYIDLYGAEIARRHNIYLHPGRGGNRTYVFIRMRDGIRCPDCWDEILQQRSRTQCTTCKDTGYLGGYYNPIEMYVSFGPEAVAVQGGIDGPDITPDSVNTWASNFPLLNIGDILIEYNTNRMWEVQSINITMHKRIVTRQEMVLSKMEGDDPTFKLIDRLPKEDAVYGQSVFKDDSTNS